MSVMSDERRPWSDDDLVLHHYGEHPDSAALERALAEDGELRRRLERLRLVLAVTSQSAGPVPEPDAGFEARLWRRVAPRLRAPGRRQAAVRWALAAGLAGLVAGAFFLGRTMPPADAARAIPEQAQERILRAAVARHLERVERLFVDLDHGRALAAASEGEGEPEPLRELLQDNRLYRATLDSSGEARLVRFLDEIEPLLAELAHASGEAVATSELRSRLRERDFLFKLRVVLRRLHGTPDAPAPSRALLTLGAIT